MESKITCPKCNHTFDVGDARFHVPAGRDVPKDKHIPAPLDCESHGTTIVEVVQFLISAGYHQAKAERGDTTLHVAARYGNVEIIQFLVDEGTEGLDVNGKNRGCLTPLHWAAYENADVEAVKHLVSLGANIHAEDKDGNTALHLAARNNVNVEVAKFLVSEGANVHAEDQYGLTPLHWAAGWNENNAVVRFLVSAGADINATDKSGNTPLDHAGRNRTKVRYLKSKGAKPGT